MISFPDIDFETCGPKEPVISFRDQIKQFVEDMFPSEQNDWDQKTQFPLKTTETSQFETNGLEETAKQQDEERQIGPEDKPRLVDRDSRSVTMGLESEDEQTRSVFSLIEIADGIHLQLRAETPPNRVGMPALPREPTKPRFTASRPAKNDPVHERPTAESTTSTAPDLKKKEAIMETEKEQSREIQRQKRLLKRKESDTPMFSESKAKRAKLAYKKAV